MANIDFPVRHVPRRNHLYKVLGSSEVFPWIHAPRFGWECELTWQDLQGDYSTMSLIITFGGTEDNGDYVSVFVDEAGATIATVTTNRAGGLPATNADLAAQHAADINAETDLDDVLDGDAADDGEDVAMTFVQGRFITVTHTQPVGATLTNDYSLALDLNSISSMGGFPDNAIRSWVFAAVTEACGATRTLTLDDDPASAAVLTAIDINTVARHCSATTDAGYQPRPEVNWTPTATIALGSTNTLTQGAILIEVLFLPSLENVAGAA